MTENKSQAAAMNGFMLGHLLLELVVVLVHTHEAYGKRGIDPSAVPVTPTYGLGALNRSSFPHGFVFGASSSAYQVEGAWNLHGKGPSNWDNFTHTFPEKIHNHNNGDVACDSYHRYKEDVQLLKNMNADSYRFSISWSRILPNGKLSGGINKNGIEYYNNLTNELIANGLQPMVTLFHWDTPQALEDEYGGFLSERVLKDFHDYADLCFKNFGDRVKYWITLNEPVNYAQLGYDIGTFPPGRCSAWMNRSCTGGDSGTEPYRVAHNLLLAHADVVQLYRTKYQKLHGGIIGMSIPGTLGVPLSNSALDRVAATRYTEFSFGWFANPIVYGDYPPIMREAVGDRLPKFTRSQSQLLSGSFDFFGFNYYTAMYMSHLNIPSNFTLPGSYGYDIRVNASTTDLNGKLIGEHLAGWLHVYPEGIWNYLHYIRRKYKNPIIYITENGANEENKQDLSLEEALKDDHRIRYHFKHLAYVKKAIDDGVRVKGYYGWSILDNFEWLEGYSMRFGINYVDFKTLRRYPKLSAQWFKRFLHK